MNNKGKTSGTSIWLAVIGVAVILVALSSFGVFQNFAGGNDPQDPSLSPNTCADSTATLTFPAVDFYNQGTSVTVDPQVMKTSSAGSVSYVNGTSSTSYGIGEKLKVLYRAPNYINVIGDEFTVNCGMTTAPEQKLYATNTNTFRVFSTNNNLLTDAAAGGATNQTSSAAPISLELKMDSKVDQSTGDLLVVIEGVNQTSTDDIVLSGNGATRGTVPSYYTNNAALSIARAYNVAAVLDGQTATYTLTLSPKSGQTIGAGNQDSFYITAYSKQSFRDADGSFTTGVENSQGTTQYEDTWDFDFMVATA